MILGLGFQDMKLLLQAPDPVQTNVHALPKGMQSQCSITASLPLFSIAPSTMRTWHKGLTVRSESARLSGPNVNPPVQLGLF